MRIYGPVPSRRFGLSLGVDILPHKSCPLDCIYCQLGPTDVPITARTDFYDPADILADVQQALKEGPVPDVITLAGSGEPGLYRSLGLLIEGLRRISDIPILLITNGILLTDPDMAAAAILSDMLAPSLDAGDEETFLRVNRPAPGIRFNDVVTALQKTTHAHPGQVFLEIMLIRDVNDSEDSLLRMNEIIRTLRVDRIDLNTPVRPPVPERGAIPCAAETLERARRIFGHRAVPIARFDRRPDTRTPASQRTGIEEAIRRTLMRRPCTRDDIAASHGISPEDTERILESLVAAGLIFSETQETGVFFRCPAPVRP